MKTDATLCFWNTPGGRTEQSAIRRTPLKRGTRQCFVCSGNISEPRYHYLFLEPATLKGLDSPRALGRTRPTRNTPKILTAGTAGTSKPQCVQTGTSEKDNVSRVPLESTEVRLIFKINCILNCRSGFQLISCLPCFEEDRRWLGSLLCAYYEPSELSAGWSSKEGENNFVKNLQRSVRLHHTGEVPLRLVRQV